MIYATGDTHGFLNYNKILYAIQNKKIKEGDYLIIAGDFGGIWNLNTLQQDISIYDKLPCTTLFIDGNHENFDILNSFPICYWNGGKVHKVSQKLFHLMRGQVFGLEGLRILTLGGAESMDKEYRIPFYSWWEQESITQSDIDEARKNLQNDSCVDYIITHTCAEKLITKELLALRKDKSVQKSEYLLNELISFCNFNHWIFGHWHIDDEVSNKVRAVYNDIICLGLN